MFRLESPLSTQSGRSGRAMASGAIAPMRLFRGQPVVRVSGVEANIEKDLRRRVAPAWAGAVEGDPLRGLAGRTGSPGLPGTFCNEGSNTMASDSISTYKDPLSKAHIF